MTKTRIRTYHDLLQLPDFRESIDPLAQPLRRILTGYHLESEYPCGLKGCHQPHKEGFLVELEDGGLTNVGWKCGAGFGDKFAAEKRRYAEEELRPKAIAVLHEAGQKIREMKFGLARLAAEADRLSRCKQGLRSLLPTLYRDLLRRAHGGDARVIEQIARTEKEIQDMLALNPSARRDDIRYREEARGVLPGLALIAKPVREEVIGKLTSRAEELVETNVAALGTDKLLDWEGWALRFDENLAAAQRLLSAGDALFSLDGFRLLAFVATVPAERTALSTLSTAVLLRGAEEEGASTPHAASPTKPMSKKQRDIQKRLEATLRAARNCRR